MNDLTILSIMRNSTPYLSRYLSQLSSAFAHFHYPHLVVCEGDSDDGTRERLESLDLRANFTLLRLDTGGPLWPSVSHPSRWRQLETVWNACLDALEPTRIAVCVESDLIWDWPTLEALITHVENGLCDVACALVMRDTPQTGLYFYDTNAFTRDGAHFSNYLPYHPALAGGERFVELDTGGGMLVTTYATLRRARWKDQCVLRSEERRVGKE